MAARNDITGDLIKTKVSDDKQYKSNYDQIDWSKKLEDKPKEKEGDKENETN
jgi:hypothetical protein